MNKMSNNKILAEHSKAVISSQDSNQQISSEVDQFFSTPLDGLIGSDHLFSDLFFPGDCQMENIDHFQKSESQTCFDMALLNENNDGDVLQDPSTNTAFSESFSSKSIAEFSPNCLLPNKLNSEESTSSKVALSSSSMRTLQYIDSAKGQLVQCPTRATTPISPNAEPLLYDEYNKLHLIDPNAPVHSSHRFNDIVAHDNNDINLSNTNSASSNIYLLPYSNVDLNNNDTVLPYDCGGTPRLGSVSPLSNDSGFASPTVNSPQLNYHMSDIPIEEPSLFQDDILNHCSYDAFGNHLFSLTEEPLCNAIDIKPPPISCKITLKSKSSLHLAKITKRSKGRYKLSEEEKLEKKKESDRKSAQRYRAKKARQKKNSYERLAQLTTSLENRKGQLAAYKQMLRDSLFNKLEIPDLDEKQLDSVCSKISSLGEEMLKHGFPTIL